MTVFAGIILGVTLLSAIMGLIRGLTREVLGLASWVGGASLTFIGMPFVQIIARRYIQNGMMADVAAAAGLFLLFLVLFSVISQVLSGLIKQSVLGGIDRSLGFLFGVGRSLAILCIFQLLVSCFMPRHKQPSDFQNNRFAPMIYKGSDVLLSILPDQVTSKIFEQQQKLNVDMAVAGAASLANTMAGATSNVVNDAAQGIANSVGNCVANGIATGMGFATPGQMANNLKQPTTAQQQAENLARLQPRAIVPVDGVQVTAKQQNDLNRLLNMQDMDEEGALEAEAQETQPTTAPATMPGVMPGTMPKTAPAMPR